MTKFNATATAYMNAKSDADLRGVIAFAAIGYMSHQADLDAAADLARSILEARGK